MMSIVFVFSILKSRFQFPLILKKEMWLWINFLELKTSGTYVYNIFIYTNDIVDLKIQISVSTILFDQIMKLITLFALFRYISYLLSSSIFTK